ncbi:MAG: multidrug efflux SMR transporter [Pseudomonadota bacterium]
MTAGWVYLAIAIVCEIAATSALKESDGMARPLPAVAALVGYAIAFICLARALRTIPLGVAYAIWSGVGILCLTLIGLVVYKQPITAMQYGGILAIAVGVVMLGAN